jgi:hypothetical protein
MAWENDQARKTAITCEPSGRGSSAYESISALVRLAKWPRCKTGWHGLKRRSGGEKSAVVWKKDPSRQCCDDRLPDQGVGGRAGVDPAVVRSLELWQRRQERQADSSRARRGDRQQGGLRFAILAATNLLGRGDRLCPHPSRQQNRRDYGRANNDMDKRPPPDHYPLAIACTRAASMLASIVM